MLELKVPFAFVRTRYARFCGVRICPAGFGLMRYFIGEVTYAHWPDASGHSAWEKLDELGPHSLCHDLERDRHVFGSYVTGHLPREHPHVADTTHDDRAEEGVFLGNDLTTPTFWLWSFKHKKAMRMSDPKHFDHILPFLQPADVHHTIPLTDDDAF